MQFYRFLIEEKKLNFFPRIFFGSFQPDDVETLMTGKVASKFVDRTDIEALKAIASASKNRSLKDFEASLQKYKNELLEDPVINYQLSSLYESLFEQNLKKIIEPYSRVEIDHLAQLMQLDRPQVENK